MQNLGKAILHLQIEIDSPYPAGWTATKSFFKYKLSKQYPVLPSK